METIRFLIIDKFPTKYAIKFINNVCINKTTGCWDWIGMTQIDGYGRFTYLGKSELAHRIAYAWLIGKIPRGRGKNILVIDHLCDNRGCVNPLHLKLVTDSINFYRSSAGAAINRRKTHCIHGHVLPEPKIISTTGKKMRICKVCKKVYDARRYASGIKRQVDSRKRTQ